MIRVTAFQRSLVAAMCLLAVQAGANANNEKEKGLRQVEEEADLELVPDAEAVKGGRGKP